MIPPPGYNLDTMTEIAEEIERRIKPLWADVSGPEVEPGGPPKMSASSSSRPAASTFLGAVSVEPQRAGELIPVLRGPVFREPGTFGFINQPSIFGRGIGSGRKIDLDISGPDLEHDPAGRRPRRRQAGPGPAARARATSCGPTRGSSWARPKSRVIPDRLRLADNGVTARELAETVDTFNDGLRVAEVTVGNDRLDLVLKGPDEQRHRDPGHRRPAGRDLGRPDHPDPLAGRQVHPDRRADRDPPPRTLPHRHPGDPPGARDRAGIGPGAPAPRGHRPAAGRGPAAGHQVSAFPAPRTS